MAKINERSPLISWAYKIGFFAILILPVVILPPYFFPADWGKSIVFRCILSILLLLCTGQILYKKNALPAAIKNNKMTWAIGGLFTIFLLASIFSVDPLFSFWGSPYRGGGFVTFAFLLIFAIIAFVFFKKSEWKKAWMVSIVTGVLVSLIGIIQYYGLFNKIFLAVPDRPPSTMGNPDLLAVYLLLLSFITLAFAIKEKITYIKVFYIFSFFIFLYTILIAGSRAAYLGLLIGGIYLLLCYPKKIRAIKIAAVVAIIAVIGTIAYANAINKYPASLMHNQLFESVIPRLSVKNLVEDPRFAAWQIEWSALMARPVLGYGPENFAVGFDKYYNPSIPYLGRDVDWYDKAHNIIFQTGIEAGIPGIIAYLALLIILFWQLQKTKRRTENLDTKIMIGAIQATVIGYFAANLFSFDSFSTYLIFFLLVGYSMHIIAEESGSQNTPLPISIKGKPLIMGALGLGVIIFLWQGNILPFYLNGQINKASDLANETQCSQALSLMDNVLANHTFLDSYARTEYVEFTKTCATAYPENNTAYFTKDLSLLQQAVKIQPLYTRFWIFLGSSEDSLAKQAEDATIKNNLIAESKQYLAKALQLAPKHQEIFVEETKTAITAQDYSGAQNYAEKCISLNPALGDCYWYLGLSEIYAKDTGDANQDMQIALSKGYATRSLQSLNELSDAYGSIFDYQDLSVVYQELVGISPNSPQYHSSLAFFYAKLGRYADARKEAMIVLQLSPESKPNVDAFLNTLPR